MGRLESVTARWGCDRQASKSAPASKKKGAALHLQAAPDFGCGGPQPSAKRYGCQETKFKSRPVSKGKGGPTRAAFKVGCGGVQPAVLAAVDWGGIRPERLPTDGT